VPRPRTIDEVIDALGAIVDDARERGDRRGYFATLYRRTTVAVRDGIRAGRFADGPRMDRLDVLFADRYFDAYEAYERGASTPPPWSYAFARAKEAGPTVLQHLLLGVNAHIAFDLALSACDTCPGETLNDLKGDFFEINRLLAEIVDGVQADLNRASPRLARLDRWGGRFDERLAAAFLARARAAAWRKAVTFSAAPPEARPVLIRRWERQVEGIARRICPPPEHRWHPARTLAAGLRVTDPDDVPAVLDAIA
jgi:hypothetical protein